MGTADLCESTPPNRRHFAELWVAAQNDLGARRNEIEEP
jgi:hypothetical protein